YISFVDSDDMLHPYFMSYLLKLCKENNADIAQCDFLMVRGEEDILPPQKVEYVHVFEPKEMLAKTYMGFESVRYIVAWNKLYRRHIFDEIRFPEGKIHEDSYTTHKLFWESKRIAISNQYLYWYLQRADSIIGKKFSIERLDSIEASRLKCKFFKDNNLIKEYYEMSVSHYNNLWRNYNLVKENIESPDEIMKKIEREAEQVKSEILSCEYGVLLDKLRTIYSHAPEKEKDIYKKMYGDRITYTSKAFFRFPFGAIKKNSQIAMFGAGGVGKSYFEQIKNGEYCELVVWVDNLWNNYVKEGYDVQPIKRLLDKEYDVILLAVQSKAVADEIAENLTSWGVDSKKIIWEYPDDRQGSREEFIKKSNNITQSQKRRIVLLNTADYGNIGDQILAEKAIEFLKKYFKQYDIIEVSGRQWDATKDIIKSKLTPEDVLLFVGGGFMGDLWTLESNRVKEIIDNFQENKKVFLPQSFFYSSDNFSYSVMQDKAFFEKYDNILYIHREDYSYRFFVDNISKMEYNLLSPDMALYAEGYETKYEREGIVSCFRMDKEKIHSNTHEIVYNYCCNNNISYRALDTIVDRSISRKNRKMEINKLLNEFCKAKLVVTDRLHGMLFCAITRPSKMWCLSSAFSRSYFVLRKTTSCW
ncbi:MAG: polysaccharide pyruvyl transferase family protein, partial [Clostridia bacterium]|nr:polysaccharide pyruvyl transferase family protein [Clostridia bacterium]